MHYSLTFLIFSLMVIGAMPALNAAPLHHDLIITLDPERNHLSARDTLTFPSLITRSGESTLEFRLHPQLEVQSPTPNVKLTRVDDRYQLTIPAGTDTAVLAYEGSIDHPVHDGAGVFLSGASLWYPRFDAGSLSFSIEIHLPAGWDAVSQGRRTQHRRTDDGTRVRWEESSPQQEIYLVAARFHEYSRQFGPVKAMAFLRSDDAELAGRYLEATGQYLAMFSDLLGPYPYDKFALVENFRETGYGMPSFTLLGSTVIRLPFILHSSYPHELLHNWWGNGVYIDYARGNWAEGLTSYLADHLLQEQRGAGAMMRRNYLQRYVDHVDAASDFPLIDFRSRHSEATEAVGYGKTLMFFHMLRRQMGDAAFIAGLRDLYQDRLFETADWDDLRQALAPHAGSDLRDEFRQWTIRTGAPQLRIEAARSHPGDDGAYRLELLLSQTQPGPDYDLRLPLAIALEGRDHPHEIDVRLHKSRQTIVLDLPARPLRVEVDPQFDLFRRVDRLEIPPALSQLFGARQLMLVYPAEAPTALRARFRALARDWRGRSPELDIALVSDREIRQLPVDRDIWLLGWDNRFVPDLRAALGPLPVRIEDGRLELPDGVLQRDRHSAVLVARHPADHELAIGWMATDDIDTVTQLARRLPHFGRYGWLGFDGESLENSMRGQWPVMDSPLAINLPCTDCEAHDIPPMEYAPRSALTDRNRTR